VLLLLLLLKQEELLYVLLGEAFLDTPAQKNKYTYQVTQAVV
jgi:hypothetical protein